jgi:hypothetical protein
MDAQEYLEFVTILEDMRTRIETVLTDPTFSASGRTAARLKRVAADLERSLQTYRDKTNASTLQGERRPAATPPA